MSISFVTKSKYYDRRGAGLMSRGGERKHERERVERTTRQTPVESGRRALRLDTSRFHWLHVAVSALRHDLPLQRCIIKCYPH